LLLLGHKVICFDNFDPFYDRKIKLGNLFEAGKNSNFTLIEGDVRNQNDLEHGFHLRPVDLVIHLAAKAGVLPSIKDPRSYFDVNVIGTLNILETMNAFGVKKMLLASSSSVYGNNMNVPFCESDRVDFPISPYAASKKSAELLCHTYHHLYDFDIFCLRFFTVYGPRQRPDLAIHKFTRALLHDEEITFYGDGSSKRDYTHITDIINGIEGAIKNLKGFNIFNLGESKMISLETLIEFLEKFTNRTVRLNKLPVQAGDVMETYANIEKARKFLNYKPSVDIEDGLKDFVDWYKNGGK
jgi:UDP-glucuronate 4-epimerase